MDVKLNLSDLFVGNEKLLDFHKCSICKDILKNPVGCTNCESHYCLICVEQLPPKSYPCHNSCNFIQTKPSKILLDLLDLLKFKCVNVKNGCEEKMINYSLFFKHIEDCGFYLTNCIYCENFVLSKNISDHLDICSMAPIKCNECNLTFIRKESLSHNDTACLKLLYSSLKNKNGKLNEYCKILEERLVKQSEKIDDVIKYCKKFENLINFKCMNNKLIDEEINETESSINKFDEKKDYDLKIKNLENKVLKIETFLENDFLSKKENSAELLNEKSKIMENDKKLYLEDSEGKKNEEINKYISSLEQQIENLQSLLLKPARLKFKIYNNKPLSYFLDFGFKIIYEKPYSHITTIQELEEISAHCDENSLICVGGKKTGESNLAVCCVDEALKVLTKTNDKQVSVKGKGAFWYYVEGESFGFTDQKEISLRSANKKYNGNTLSWHLQGTGGWSLGNVVALNNSNDFEKIIMLLNKLDYYKK